MQDYTVHNTCNRYCKALRDLYCFVFALYTQVRKLGLNKN